MMGDRYPRLNFCSVKTEENDEATIFGKELLGTFVVFFVTIFTLIVFLVLI